MTVCLFCREPIATHCAAKLPCKWRRCGRCKVTFDPDQMRAFNNDGPVAWPHSKPA